jgi:hypothetical protein
MHPARLLFAIVLKICMSGGMLIVLIIPAILAFIFGAWVMYNVMVDVSNRNATPPYTIVGPDTVRVRVEPPG